MQREIKGKTYRELERKMQKGDRLSRRDRQREKRGEEMHREKER